MLGKRDKNGRLFGAKRFLLTKNEKKLGFYGQLAKHGRSLFRDEDFAAAYSPDRGRPSAPPSLLAIARLLQHYEGISDAEVINRCRFDLRWKVALDQDMGSIESPFAKSTFQAFRSRITLYLDEGLAFERSIAAAKEAGLLPSKLRVALDSSPVRGRGAVKDTFNLLSDAIVAVVRAIARQRQRTALEVADSIGVRRHVDCPSVKGSEMLDWGDDDCVSAFLGRLLSDCNKAVAAATEAGCATQEVALLEKVIAQDVEESDGENAGPQIREGVTPDRTISVHDPEMRTGHKSHGKTYSGHKAHVAVDVDSGVITAVEVTEPRRSDGTLVGRLIDETETLTDRDVSTAVGDGAYSSRNAIRAADRRLVALTAKMPRARAGRLSGADFEVSRNGRTARCPAGHLSRRYVRQGERGLRHEWDRATCGACKLRSRCTKAPARTLVFTPDFHSRRERERRARSPAGRQCLRLRIAVEHAIGRLKNKGAGKSRYFGRAKTKAQWQWTAAVLNLNLIWRHESALAPG